VPSWHGAGAKARSGDGVMRRFGRRNADSTTPIVGRRHGVSDCPQHPLMLGRHRRRFDVAFKTDALPALALAPHFARHEGYATGYRYAKQSAGTMA
jgi:hypothetical protein